MCVGTSLRLASCAASGFCFIGSGSANLMKKDVKMGYGLLSVLFCGILFLLIFFGSEYINFFSHFITCPKDVDLEVCLGISSAFRFTLAAFHLLMLLCCLTRDGFAKCMNEGLWFLKICAVLLGFVGTLFLPNSLFLKYAQVAVYLGGVYLFAQMVSIVDGVYLWAEYWAKKFDDGNNCYGCLLIFASLLMYAATGYLLFISFDHFWVSGCFINKFILIIITGFVVAYIVLILLKFHPNGSVITSGAISVYAVYLGWSSFLADPKQQCNPWKNKQYGMILQIIGSVFFGFVCTMYWSFSSRPSKSYAQSGVPNLNHEELEEKEEDFEKEPEQNQRTNGEVLIDKPEEEKYRAYQDNSYIKFHGFMILFSIYISPVFSNWGHANISNGHWDFGNDSSIPMWIKFLITFGSLLLYLWTIIAPRIFPDRDFVNDE